MNSISHPKYSQIELFRKCSALAVIMAYIANGAIQQIIQHESKPIEIVAGLIALQGSFLIAVLLPAFLIFKKKQIPIVLKLRKLNISSCAKISGLASISFPFILLSAIATNIIMKKAGISFVDRLMEFLMTRNSYEMTLLVFSGIFVAPIAEELAFRLSIFDFLRRFLKGSRFVLPTILSAIVFSILHGDPVRAAGLFVLGIILQYVMIKYRSLLAPILFHAVHNMLAFAAFFILS
ncbi:MAG TPA: type II CAAX endopeptidase family protein [Victivallales bacterium]|nr:type II CAAX endopeptidase family protein [Victivallales bacterium]